MAYEYYCLNCGKTLSQETVLFDMQRLLIEDENFSFNTLRFRLTHHELKNLIASGTPAEGNYRRCTLTLSQIMGYISNANNLDDSRIASLTLEQINEYTAQVVAEDPFTLWDWSDEDLYKEAEGTAPEEQVKKLPEALQALEEKVTYQVGDGQAAELLKCDLEYLKNAFFKGNYVVKLKEQMEPYENNQEILVGFGIQYPVSKRNYSIVCRICPQCTESVPRVAGTARHRAVVFIGNPNSGKTSTILALAHYAENYMVYGLASEIWGHSRRIESVKTIELVEGQMELCARMENYAKGVAPDRTMADRREQADSATFLIKSGNRSTLLTLTDIPGEICNRYGDNKVDENAVRNQFQVATGCDAFVVCIDTESIRRDSCGCMSPGKIISSIYSQANAFQQLRKENTGNDFIPTMLLFTKCRELETENLDRPNDSDFLSPLERIYMFREEKRIIEGDDSYCTACKVLNDSFYHAMLRCSPFGYRAPHRFGVENGGRPEKPAPRNVDQLMHWLLMVCGCVPVDAYYCPNISGEGGGFRLDNYFIDRAQCRSDRPLDEWNNLMAGWNYKEALARCRLFENPGFQDKLIMEDWGQNRFVTAAHKLVHGKAGNDR